MSTNNTTTTATVAQETTKTVKVLNGEQIATLLGALRTMHEIVWDAGKNEAINPSFDNLSTDEIGTVCVRAINAINAHEKRAKDAKDGKVRQAVNGVLETYFARARAEKEEYNALSDSLKARLGAFPTFVNVSVNDLQGVLETSNPSVMIKKLFDLGVCKIDARSIAKAKEVKSIAIPLPA